MSLSVTFPTELESALRQRAAAVGKDVDTFVREIVIDEVSEVPASSRRKRSREEFVSRLREIIESHGIKNGKFDDSRESIYSGRGE
jgi:plasmid stability protein